MSFRVTWGFTTSEYRDKTTCITEQGNSADDERRDHFDPLETQMALTVRQQLMGASPVSDLYCGRHQTGQPFSVNAYSLGISLINIYQWSKMSPSNILFQNLSFSVIRFSVLPCHHLKSAISVK